MGVGGSKAVRFVMEADYRLAIRILLRKLPRRFVNRKSEISSRKWLAVVIRE
jgi:hypothetical protein